MPAMIPVSVLTGFLGSGKTTLLGRLLRDPAMGRTAVIMNEFGAVGLDHELIETSDESFVQLTTGCLCCQVRGDLVLTLADLAARRAAGTVPPFERVVIETSGLADPAPILHALMTDDVLADNYALAGVVTTVDAVNGAQTLMRHRESLRQAAVADHILLTKTDLAEVRPAALIEELGRINPMARVSIAVRGAISPQAVFGVTAEAASQRPVERFVWRDPDVGASLREHLHADHAPAMSAIAIVREQPLHAATLSLLLSALAENCGANLLRMKGIVQVAERPECPAVIHGVQHVYHAPEWLERWPSDDRRTRIVFIGHALNERWLRALIAILDDEVAREAARRESSA